MAKLNSYGDSYRDGYRDSYGDGYSYGDNDNTSNGNTIATDWFSHLVVIDNCSIVV